MEVLTNSQGDNPTLALDNSALNHLEETRKWTLFLSIVGFVYMVFMIIALLVISTVGLAGSFPVMRSFMLIPALLLLCIFFFPVYYLLQFARYSKIAIMNRDSQALSTALLFQKRHYRFIGILTIVMVGLYLIMIPFFMFTGGFLRGFNF